MIIIIATSPLLMKELGAGRNNDKYLAVNDKLTE